MAGTGHVVGLKKHFQADDAGFAVEAEGDLLRAEGLEEFEVDSGFAEEVVLVAHVPVENAEAEFGGCSGLDRTFEELVPGGMKSLFLDLRFVDVFVVEPEFAVWVAEAIAICSR